MGRLAIADLGNRCLIAATAAILLVIVLLAGTRSAAAEPEVTEMNLEQSDVLDAPPDSVRMCFSEPVQLSQDPEVTPTLEPGAEPPWMFNMTTSEGVALGLRIVFEPSGECVEVFPGLPEDPPQGTWMFEWLVKAQSDGEEASDLITFAVGRESQNGSTAGSSSDSDGLGALEIVLIVIAATCIVGGGVMFATQRIRRSRTR